MKIKRTTLSLLIIVGLLLVNFSTVLAGGPPGLPSSFYGTVMVDGSSVPAGVAVSAWINGVSYVDVVTQSYGGQILYSINVPADDSSTTEIEGGKAGDTIVFHIGSLTAVETGTWNAGSNVQLNLTAWNEYTLTINSAHGTVIKNPDKATYHLNEGVSLLADPVDGWSFTSWIGAASGS